MQTFNLKDDENEGKRSQADEEQVNFDPESEELQKGQTHQAQNDGSDKNVIIKIKK